MTLSTLTFTTSCMQLVRARRTADKPLMNVVRLACLRSKTSSRLCMKGQAWKFCRRDLKLPNVVPCFEAVSPTLSRPALERITVTREGSAWT